MKSRIGQSILLVLCARLAFGCASIIHGSTQDVIIASSPDRAEVWIDGIRMAVTPGRVTLQRKHDYAVVIKKEGFRDLTMRIEGKPSGWLFGNIIFGGLIGCGIDLATGAAYDLKPARIDVRLSQIASLDGKTILMDRETLDNLKEIRFLNVAGEPEVVAHFAEAK